MKIIDGIVYAHKDVENIEVVSVKTLDDMMLLLTFNNEEERLFDASTLVTMEAFKPLLDSNIFNSCVVVDGIVTWDNGNIDIAPETMYTESYKYERLEAF